MNKQIEAAIEYIRGYVDMEDVEFTINYIYKHHGSLRSHDPVSLREKIRDLMNEYGNDNDLEEGWWEFLSEEDILIKL